MFILSCLLTAGITIVGFVKYKKTRKKSPAIMFAVSFAMLFSYILYCYHFQVRYLASYVITPLMLVMFGLAITGVKEEGQYAGVFVFVILILLLKMFIYFLLGLWWMG